MNNKYGTLTLFSAMIFAGQAYSQALPPMRCTSVTVDTPSQIVLGKSTVVKLSTPATRMVVGGLSSTRAGKPVEVVEDKNLPPGQRQMMLPVSDGIADVDVMLLSPTELFFLGKHAGSMNVVLQGADGECQVKDLIVTIDPGALQAKLAELMPEETGIRVKGAENSLVLTGVVSSAVKLDQVVSLATSYGDGKKLVNLLRVTSPQQVMLEVKVAEVSKTILDRLGFDLTRAYASGDGTSVKIMSGLFGGNALFAGHAGGLAGANVLGQFGTGSTQGNPMNAITGPVNSAGAALPGGDATTGMIDAQKKDGLVRLLAEPNIMAISGQQASFLSGGKIFIPVTQASTVGSPTMSLEEREFGIGVKFTPTVLDGTRVNLKMVTEVSDLSQTGSAFTTVNNVTSVLPSFTIRRADTTVQLNDGQSFVIAGLIKNNITETIKRFPGLGDIPILGALFRSSEFQKDQTELLFVITPRLVKPLAAAPKLPTDNHVEPGRSDIYINGSMEGSAPAPAPAAPAAPVSVAPTPSAPAPTEPVTVTPLSAAPVRPESVAQTSAAPAPEGSIPETAPASTVPESAPPVSVEPLPDTPAHFEDDAPAAATPAPITEKEQS
ncbi:MAG TPA: hypothetical protein VIU93_10060 [Gallionellaceae bacterium]